MREIKGKKMREEVDYFYRGWESRGEENDTL